MILPEYICKGLCPPTCKNNCPLNKYIWMRDYIEPPPELYLEIDLYKLNNKDIHFIKRSLPHIIPELLSEYKKIKDKQLKKKLRTINEETPDKYHIDYEPLPRIMKKPVRGKRKGKVKQ